MRWREGGDARRGEGKAGNSDERREKSGRGIKDGRGGTQNLRYNLLKDRRQAEKGKTSVFIV